MSGSSWIQSVRREATRGKTTCESFHLRSVGQHFATQYLKLHSATQLHFFKCQRRAHKQRCALRHPLIQVKLGSAEKYVGLAVRGGSRSQSQGYIGHWHMKKENTGPIFYPQFEHQGNPICKHKWGSDSCRVRLLQGLFQGNHQEPHTHTNTTQRRRLPTIDAPDDQQQFVATSTSTEQVPAPESAILRTQRAS